MSGRMVGDFYPRQSRPTRNCKVSDLTVGMEILRHKYIIAIEDSNGTFFAEVRHGKSEVTTWKYLGTAESEITIVES